MSGGVASVFRLANGFSLERLAGGDVRLTRYADGAEPASVDIPAERWIDAILAVASPPSEGWKPYHNGQKVPDDVNARLVRIELDRIHYGRTNR